MPALIIASSMFPWGTLFYPEKEDSIDISLSSLGPFPKVFPILEAGFRFIILLFLVLSFSVETLLLLGPTFAIDVADFAMFDI